MKNQPVSVFDLTAHLFQEYRTRANQKVSMTAMKLQKLVYYCQAWSLAWDEGPIFKQRIEAWIHGPVVPELFGAFEGKYRVWRIPAGIENNPGRLAKAHKATANKILEFYGPFKPEELTGLTHSESPWREAREIAGLGPTERGSQEIPHIDMRKYYSEIHQHNQSQVQ